MVWLLHDLCNLVVSAKLIVKLRFASIYLFYLLQYEKILKVISTAKSEGATIVCGGAHPEV